MNALAERYLPIIKTFDVSGTDERLLLDRSGPLDIFYAPFDYVNRDAKIVIVGITPGLQQMVNAIRSARSELLKGGDVETVLRRAKSAASFSGPMRTNLVKLLDRFHLNEVCGVATTGELFLDGCEAAHFTSVLRYPAFLKGKNYAGSPSPLKQPLLASYLRRYFLEEIKGLERAVFVPLGPVPEAVLETAVAEHLVPSERVVIGLPHPSPANAERIAYVMGEKPKEALSSKTNPDILDFRADMVRDTVKTLLRTGPAPAFEPAE
jgi:hypothetical protein